ncbi:MAG: hypothetical protein AVDCRST_MAG34-1360 [uncultured Nocardioidaceae bacterium]|uniref:Amino acid transporter n=1 Tax=uncultured Nocardioidaceae bacterium TaxID=253824 RepID=A0A6J4M1M1_9ACTN|nr:MAG: hypothetical protein AVDCRST_MAG34-1360 [uncultured Nocardioidaceae bacterium]
MPTDPGPWKPMTPSEVAGLLGGVDFPWWVAGGWAIDLFLGRQTRDHDDIDVLILRDDQGAMQQALSGWDLHAADPPGSLRHWRAGEVLSAGVHDIWCRRDPGSPWSLQIMIDDAQDGMWQYRSDNRITRPVSELDGNAVGDAARVLAPEVQLLQKSRSPRPKDEADFRAVRRMLGIDQRDWLVSSLTLVSPTHHWLTQL